MPETVLYFDRFELRLTERLLLRDGEVVPLRARAFDLLAILAHRAGRLVTKDELLREVWPGLVVEENNIAAQVVALRKALHNELIVTVPGRGYRFVARPQAAEKALPTAEPLQLRLIGREHDLERLEAALAQPGCVTLVGPGGVGKTSLAQVLYARTPGPRQWIDLSTFNADDQLLPALCRALDHQEVEGDAIAALADALGATRLLALDNVEHLVEAAALLVSRLRNEAPGLRLLVTSQVPLAIEGERVERIEPLALPAANVPDEQALHAAAMAMFTSRVLAADSRFEFPPESLPLARRLCTSLDGMPLALEMAAARVPLLGMQRVHDGLVERFALLRRGQRDAPGRHRTLQAALDWSYSLLGPQEQRVFRTLGVFAGGFTLDLAVAVATEEDEDRWDTIDRLALLVDRSLVVGNHEDPPRYQLLETMRSYALARLRAFGEEHRVRACHAASLEALFQAAYDVPQGPCDEVPRRLALAEMQNAREALTWATTHDPALAVRLSSYAAFLSTLTVWRAEVFSWLSACEPLAAREDIDMHWRALWWRHYSAQTLYRCDERAIEHSRHAAKVCRAAGEEWDLAFSLINLASALDEPCDELDATLAEMQALSDRHPEWPAYLRVKILGTQAHASELEGDANTALSFSRAEFALARKTGMSRAASLAAINVAHALHMGGRGEQALAQLRSCLADIEDPAGYAGVSCRILMLRVLFDIGRHQEALGSAAEVLAAARRIQLSTVLSMMSVGLAQAGRPRAAALMIGHACQQHANRGAMLAAEPRRDVERASAMVLAQLDRATFERLVAQGREIDHASAAQLLMAKGDAEG